MLGCQPGESEEVAEAHGAARYGKYDPDTGIPILFGVRGGHGLRFLKMVNLKASKKNGGELLHMTLDFAA